MSKIEWTEQTWNPIVGCSIVSPGCTNCYAMKMAARLEAMTIAHTASNGGDPGPLGHYHGTTKESRGGPVWTGKLALAPDSILTAPLRRRKATMYFVNSMSDLFHESVPDEWIDRVFAVMALCPQHTFQVLTKRSKRMLGYLGGVEGVTPQYPGVSHRVRNECLKLDSQRWDRQRGSWPLPNVWLGVSAERQQEADARIPDLLTTPAAVRFVSAEPLLGPIDFTRIGDCRGPHNALGTDLATSFDATLDWIIVGGESGPGARPMHPDWARSIRDQCVAADVPFFFKQWGNWEVALDRDRDDPDWRRDYTNDYVCHGRSRWLNLDGGVGFHGERFHVMRDVGKSRAGRLLDGREWNEYPATPAKEFA